LKVTAKVLEGRISCITRGEKTLPAAFIFQLERFQQQETWIMDTKTKIFLEILATTKKKKKKLLIIG
jgi:hypothetical protein